MAKFEVLIIPHAEKHGGVRTRALRGALLPVGGRTCNSGRRSPSPRTAAHSDTEMQTDLPSGGHVAAGAAASPRRRRMTGGPRRECSAPCVSNEHGLHVLASNPDEKPPDRPPENALTCWLQEAHIKQNARRLGKVGQELEKWCSKCK